MLTKYRKSQIFGGFRWNNNHFLLGRVIKKLNDSKLYAKTATHIKLHIGAHETGLKWIYFVQSLFILGFDDNIYNEGNISKMPNFDVFFSFGM